MAEKFEEIVLKKLDKLDNLEKEMGNLKTEIKDTQEVVTYLNNSFTKFDYEINKKIDTLFDAFITNKEKDLVHEKEISSLNAKTFNHDIRISNLENQILAV